MESTHNKNLFRETYTFGYFRCNFQLLIDLKIQNFWREIT
jgi:hypothetical protein